MKAEELCQLTQDQLVFIVAKDLLNLSAQNNFVKTLEGRNGKGVIKHLNV